ncbi:hypothetical protein [Agrobacterium larrymoorei]|uniref:Uncharacterized protein n=1 Tax=Agrobacterium larrymoorei TaxID=160699 RepID=A0AAF0KDA7_9HYPH|nr:hypothetical protein [Agrobacterium larrymoorei]WHA40571.1 hypothetical protein CFBP5477_012175 [Agrobacterium larrymoorei]
MRKAAACLALSKTLGIGLGRVTSLAQRASDAGVLPKAVGRTYPPLSADQMARLLIAVLADNGLGTVGESVDKFSRIHSSELCLSLVDAIAAAFDGGRTNPFAPIIKSIVLRNDLENPGVDILADVGGHGVHAVFGATQTTGAVKQALVAGTAFEALAREWRAAQ